MNMITAKATAQNSNTVRKPMMIIQFLLPLSSMTGSCCNTGFDDLKAGSNAGGLGCAGAPVGVPAIKPRLLSFTNAACLFSLASGGSSPRVLYTTPF